MNGMKNQSIIYPKLFFLDNSNRIRYWYMEIAYDESGLNAAYRSISGLLDKKDNKSKWKEIYGKNSGKSNATTALEQAIFEVKSAYQRKLENDYVYDRTKLTAKHFSPMLAHTYDAKTKVNKNVFVQPKLDGIRCLIKSDGLWSRGNKKIIGCNHIFNGFEVIFKDYPDLIFDGELYNHEYCDNFNKIVSIVRKSKNIDLDQQKLIQFHCYDLFVKNETFSKRYDKIVNFGEVNEFMKIVPTYLVKTKDEIDNYYKQFLSEGYEGQIIRFDSFYEQKRSKNLLKRKEFDTKEFRVLSVEEGRGNWAGYIKRFVLDLGNNITFDAAPRGTQETLKTLISERTPDWATVRFFGYTPDKGIPRFPIVIDWGYGKRED